VQYSVDRAVLLERAESAEARIADMERELADKGRRIASLEAIIRDLLDESTGPGEKSLLRATTIDRAKE
jgi:chaperonin cofactor prefoldin